MKLWANKFYMTKRFKRISPTSQKILLLLMAGVMLGFARSPKGYFKILEAVAKDWDEINRQELYRAIRRLYQTRLISMKENEDGSETAVVTRKGREIALTFEIEKMSIKPMKKWDGKWRIVLFDIPEKYRKMRDALRIVLKRMSFFEYQKSVFIHPFECQDEIDFVVEYFQLRPWVRVAVAESLDDELRLKKHFDLI